MAAANTLYIINSIMYFELDSDDIESSKRRSTLTLLIFILNCLTKPYVFRKFTNSEKRACQNVVVMVTSNLMKTVWLYQIDPG